jgi:hypothetical protein
MVARPTRKRMYRTMQGRMVDIEKLRAANENVQAVGNMNVNARGDILGPGGQIATKKETIIKKYYEQPRGMVDDTPARAKPAPAPKTPPKQTVQTMTPVAKTEIKKTEPKPEPVVAPKVESEPTPVATFKTKTQTTEKKGIDAALDGLE